jgi:hypothetical protein
MDYVGLFLCHLNHHVAVFPEPLPLQPVIIVKTRNLGLFLLQNRFDHLFQAWSNLMQERIYTSSSPFILCWSLKKD